MTGSSQPNFDDWASHIVDGIESKSPSQIEWEIVEALKKAQACAASPMETQGICNRHPDCPMACWDADCPLSSSPEQK